MTSTIELQGFAYGEDIEAATGRSIGFHLLTPKTSEHWAKEVEQLARHLQAAPYPDHWQPVDLFCSVLLSDGRRLIAVARYGLVDHTSSKRPGGVELVGVVGPGNLSVSSAFAVYHWLRQHRVHVHELRAFGERHALEEVLQNAPQKMDIEANGPLPMQWKDNDVLLFWASSPSDPDRRKHVLVDETSSNWQWLPLCGSDFPWESYRDRGRLIAWLPPHVDVAQKWSPTTPATPVLTGNRTFVWIACSVLGLLLIANLWAFFSIHGRISISSNQPQATNNKQNPPQKIVVNKGDKEGFAKALYQVLADKKGESLKPDSAARAQYEMLVARYPKLAVKSDEGQAMIGMVSLLSRYSPDEVVQFIRNELSSKKGYDPQVVDEMCKRIRDRLNAELSKSSSP